MDSGTRSVDLRLVDGLGGVLGRRHFPSHLDANGETVTDSACRHGAAEVRLIEERLVPHVAPLQLTVRRTRRRDGGVAVGLTVARGVAQREAWPKVVVDDAQYPCRCGCARSRSFRGRRSCFDRPLVSPRTRRSETLRPSPDPCSNPTAARSPARCPDDTCCEFSVKRVRPFKPKPSDGAMPQPPLLTTSRPGTPASCHIALNRSALPSAQRLDWRVQIHRGALIARVADAHRSLTDGRQTRRLRDEIDGPAGRAAATECGRRVP